MWWANTNGLGIPKVYSNKWLGAVYYRKLATEKTLASISLFSIRLGWAFKELTGRRTRLTN